MPLTTSSSPPPSRVIIFAAALLRSALGHGLQVAPHPAHGGASIALGALLGTLLGTLLCHLGVVVVVVVVVVSSLSSSSWCRYGLVSATPSSTRSISLPTASSPPPAEVPPPIHCPNWVGGRKREGRVRRSSESCAPMEGTLLGESAACHALLVPSGCSPRYSAGTPLLSYAAAAQTRQGLRAGDDARRSWYYYYVL